MKKPSIEKKAKKGKKKLAERNVLGTWLGIHPRTGEHVIAIHIGEAIRVRSVHRVVLEERWSPDAVRAVRAERNSGSSCARMRKAARHLLLVIHPDKFAMIHPACPRDRHSARVSKLPCVTVWRLRRMATTRTLGGQDREGA